MPLDERQAPASAPQKCTDLSATVDSSCWDALGIPDWLNAWYPRTKCGPDAVDDAKCCTASEAWSTCFLRLSQPTSGSDCTEIDSCNTYIPNINVDASIAPQVHYVVYNIYSKYSMTSDIEKEADIADVCAQEINHFFTTWYYATLFGKSQASDSITNIVNTIDPPASLNFFLYEALSVITAGLAFLTVPGAGAVIAVDASATAQTFVIALQQAPTVARAIWPFEGTSQTYQIGQLSEQLADMTDDIRNNINAGLHEVMTDIASFQAFAAGGTYSNPTPPSLNNETTGLEYGFTTWLVSKALTGNGWDATFTTKERVGDKDDNGNPDPTLWWCSATGNDFCYFLQKDLDNDHDSGENILSKVINTGWTNGELLFDNAFTCLQEGKSETDPIVFLDDDNKIDLNCLSQMFLCTSHPEQHDEPIACPVAFVNGACPYPACRG
ncbi:MAG: hypothetical protein M4579_002949 [Chaenotheca gracillima]|nr:MAG: hypothetical protein M4579_002949 [Chaenotheca gracillima]